MASIQGGGLTCRWLGVALSSGTPPEVRVSVLPDAAEEFAAAIGAEGAFWCNIFGDEGLWECAGSVLQDGYWADFDLFRLAESESEAIAAGEGLRDQIVSALTGAGAAGPRWSPPASALPAWDSCAVLDADGAFREAVASPALLEPQFEEMGAGYSLTAFERGGFTTCVWRQPAPAVGGQASLISVNIVPGGGWAWEDWSSTSPSPTDDLTVAGADAARIICFESGNNCNGVALVGGSVLTASVQSEDPAFPSEDTLRTALEEWIVALGVPAG